MKFDGSIFQNGMMYNFINVKDGVITIHNTDEDEHGFICSYTTKEKEEASFILSKKDCQTLSMIESFDLTVKNNVLNIKTKNTNIKLANLVDVKEFQPSMDDAEPIQVKTSEFLKGKAFVGNSKTMIQQNGANIAPEGYIVMDSHCIFYSSKETEVKEPICVPKEVFKYIENMDVCLTNGRMIAFINGNKLFYSSLMAQALSLPKNVSFDVKVSIECARSDILYNLKLLKGYSNYVQLEVNGKKMQMHTHEENNEFNISLDTEFKKGSKLSVTVNIEHFLKIMDLVESEKVTLSFNDKMMIYKTDEYIVGNLYIAQTEPREVE